MSEFNCPEPGCMFHIGIAGDLVTDEDFDAQDYYDQEIEAHERMHQAEKRKAEDREVRELRRRYSGLEGAKSRMEESYRIQAATACLIADYLVEGEHASGDLLSLYRGEKELADQAVIAYSKAWKEQADAVERLTFSPGSSLRDALIRLEGQVEISEVNPGSVQDSDESSEQSVLGDCNVLKNTDSIRQGVLSVLGNCNFERGSQKFLGLHNSSLSVGDAPFGAGVGTSESTEGDQTPVVPEMKMPSAVAAAEGDETKHSNGK